MHRLLHVLLVAWPVCFASIPAFALEESPAFSLEQIVATRIPGQFVVSPDRKSVVYTHVGRYFGHPLFPAYGEDSNLFLLNVQTMEKVQLTSGPQATTYPAFSPDGRRISYESKGDIWSVEINSGKTTRLTTDVARDAMAAWSPKADRIAFVSNRWGSSRLYVMDANGERNALSRVTGVDFPVTSPIWSPDGRFILFTAAQDEHFYSRGIYRVRASGGEPERLTPEDNARNNRPSFSPDGKTIAYISDRSGFLNIWTMSADGTEHRQVTKVAQDQDYPENDYIQTMGLHWSPDGRRLLYFSNRFGNLDLMTVEVESGRTTTVSDRDGSHHPVGWIDDRSIAYVYESYSTPPDLYLKVEKQPARQLTWSNHAVYKEEAFERLESVRWRSDDGVEVHGYLRRPSWATADDRLPALVVSHTYNVGQFYNQWNPIFSYIAQSGYILLTVNHRGSNGYGTEFRDLPKGNWGFAQLKDIESAAGFLRSRKDVDAGRLGMLGYSMGGYLTQLALTTRPELFEAGIAVFGLGEITGDPQNSSKNYVWHIGGSERELPEAYAHASPVTHVSKMQAPIQIIHSDGDPIEPVTKVRNFVYEMEKHGKPYELHIYENEAHGLKQLAHQLDSYERVMGFLQMHLGGGRK